MAQCRSQEARIIAGFGMVKRSNISSHSPMITTEKRLFPGFTKLLPKQHQFILDSCYYSYYHSKPSTTQRKQNAFFLKTRWFGALVYQLMISDCNQSRSSESTIISNIPIANQIIFFSITWGKLLSSIPFLVLARLQQSHYINEILIDMESKVTFKELKYFQEQMKAMLYLIQSYRL